MKKAQGLPPTYLFVSIVAMVALHFLLPLRRLVHPPWSYTGAGLIALGLLLNLWADGVFKKARTTVKPFETSERLVTHGPYAVSRHPMYLGMVLLLIGLALLLGSLTSFLVVPVFAYLMDRKFITPEERAMEEAFGDEYAAYRQRVRRWV